MNAVLEPVAQLQPPNHLAQPADVYGEFSEYVRRTVAEQEAPKFADVGPHRVYKGDVLRVATQFPDNWFDLVCTDPPYCTPVGGRTNLSPTSKYQSPNLESGRLPDFVGDVRTQRAFELWTTHWAAECFRITREGGAMLSFMGWTNVPSMTDALQAAGWFVDGLIPWIKPSGRPRCGWFSTGRIEYVVVARKGPTPQEGLCGPTHVVGHVASGNRIHMTEKPPDVIAELMMFRPDWQKIFDPFGGSGSTAVAAHLLGRTATLVELTDYYFDASVKRIADDIAILDTARNRT